MSGATYRIDVEHHPDTSSDYEWMARVVRLSDDRTPAVLWGKTDEEAVEKARVWVAAQNVKQPNRTLFVNDEGTDETPFADEAA